MCARHSDADAIGICGSCARGVCTACAVDMERALACRDRFEPEVRRLLDLRDFSFAQPSTQSSILTRSKRLYTNSGVFFVVLGTALGVCGYAFVYDTFLMVLGTLFCCYGLWQIFSARKAGPSAQFRLCQNCGYNISGNTSGTCPECGTRT